MNGYRNLASSPPAPSGGEPEPARPPATAKEGKWEGAAVGAAAMVRNLSSASQRFAAVERSKSTGGHRGGGFQAVVRRAFSMRRQPASSLSEGYWRIHDGLEDGDDDAEAPEEVDEQKKHQVAEAVEPEVQGDAAASSDEIGKERKKKKRGHIFKACKKLLGFKHV
ncbi:hypothetical protein CFC21_043129 [Triticum aestivum]|uniref:Uncharacterized protein n=3 Tax=Triticum TaxID=4564 RepID=A0A9R1FP23_WHEAT|nr:uncharacterized protein LOC119281814 [Triticum dicoccoides]XP_044345127.1 uncharacterized protein LOC123066024 [Triticum aestivum]VAH82502.1 unnamed protein product [Triticum turgidum subsp. durum]KAF7031873.1 hypothetical protein CFC21_043127 [Triticum aestivum]KAF7031876.1 hypothetical protein CFC21_043129 [Triticum aestivum]CDM82683.1 unnamed protein product [Triticum aestivum]